VSAPRLGRVAYVSELPQSQVLSSGLTLRDLASGKETPLSVTETGAKESSQKLFAPKLSQYFVDSLFFYDFWSK
jgi:hypothetical protein